MVKSVNQLNEIVPRQDLRNPHPALDIPSSPAIPSTSNNFSPDPTCVSPSEDEQMYGSLDNDVGITMYQADPLKISGKIVDDEHLALLKKQNYKMYRYYDSQNELIKSFLNSENMTEEGEEAARTAQERNDKRTKIAIYGSFAANIFLFGVQTASAVSSGSLSLIATMADSLMDIIASIILVLTSRAAAKTHWVEYPTGKHRLETVGAIVFSTLMATLSTELIIEAVRTITGKDHTPPGVSTINLVMIGTALVVKLLLFLYCRTVTGSSAVSALVVDHRNDLLLNSVGLVMSYLSVKIAWFFDPIGGIMLALLLLFTWSKEAFSNVRLIVGITADRDFLNKLTYTAMTHSDLILYVDTTPLQISHDTGESLQIKLEALPLVARAFVHVDYEYHHLPEHRIKSS
ncbi:hypothetical protein BB560_007082 [Smittium megazygosporum]|uniref:Cation efflux protein transmembrane domain-containing protein n=1 Tax=Smittium megazygosporum TaxID=133381 RepID=A0A2T9XYX3_9FUNG|nr:hypothetical protein BB560_007082 [Smittium megazygosporum]